MLAGLRPPTAHGRPYRELGLRAARLRGIIVLGLGLSYIGCGHKASSAPSEPPILDLQLLRGLEPRLSATTPAGGINAEPQVHQVYELNMDPSTAERTLDRDPLTAYRVEETHDAFGYSAIYVTSGRRIMAHIYAGEGKDAAPPGHCLLALHGPGAR